MLGLKSLPVNHPLHRVYRVTAGLVGAILAVFGLLGLLLSGDILKLPASSAFSVICLLAGLVLIGAAVVGRNVAAETNAWIGALLIVVGLVGLLSMGDPNSNFLDVSMADVTLLFVAGMLLLAAGFYGQVGADTHQSQAPANARG
jgi:drug/metabolite transporter (DMT)-like permease